MRITNDKDYFLTYKNFEIQLQIFRYGNNTVYFLEGYTYLIE